MKKLLMLLLSLTIIFAFTACGGGESNEPAGDGGDTPETSTQNYMEMLQDQHYYMEYSATVDYEGKEETIQAKIARDGEKMSSESTVQDMTSRILTDGETMYILDDKAKTYMEMDASMNNEEILEAGDDMKLTNSGKEEVDGQNLDFEEYTGENETVKFYLDGDNLKYILSKAEDDEILMKISKFTKDIPSGLLELPSDYVSGYPGM
ncbi:MAG TPA: DUF4412 domain-containing protein [Anaerovoracaceae bacterium]|nr:DUF4412 domain-containing protein [Anaerovoracaceae bacterium]